MNFYAVLEVARIIGIAIIAISLPLLWWRFRHTDRQVLTGIALAMVIVVLFVPAALPWYYTWPLAIIAALAQSRQSIALIAGFSTWIMVIFKPDGSHGMYSWIHVLLATACAVAAWYSLYKDAGSVRHRLGAAQHLAGLMECSASTGRALSCRSRRSVTSDRQRRIGREQPAHDLGVRVSAVVQDDEQSLQALDHLTGVVEEDLRHHHRPVAAHPDQVAVPQVLLHFGHRDAEQLGDIGQVVERPRRGRAHPQRPECCSPARV